MNSYERMVYDKYAYEKPYVYIIYEEFERRVNSTLEEYEGLKTGECRFDYRSWESRLNVTRKKLQTSIKCLSNDEVIKQVIQGKKGHGSSIYFLLRFEDNKKDNNMDNKKDNNKTSNINVLNSEEDNKKDNNMGNKKVNTSIYNNPNILSNNIYRLSKDEQKEEIPRKYIDVYEHWNNCNIVHHIKLTKEMMKAIDKALKKYSIETIKLGIDNYNTIFKDNRYFFSHKWTLQNFFTRA